MKFSKAVIPSLCLILFLGGCGNQADSKAASPLNTTTQQTSNANQAAVLTWEDLMPEGEDERLAELYAEFYEEQEMRFIEQMNLSQAAAADAEGADDLMSIVQEGSEFDTMDQIGTFNVVSDLDGQSIRLPGYVVPLDFNADSEYDQFLLVPYFGACLHTPPPPPNQIVFVKSDPAMKIPNIYEPVWVEGIMKTGQFGSDLGNSAYELTLANLDPYEY